MNAEAKNVLAKQKRRKTVSIRTTGAMYVITPPHKQRKSLHLWLSPLLIKYDAGCSRRGCRGESGPSAPIKSPILQV
jgi:hypothetical protein